MVKKQWLKNIFAIWRQLCMLWRGSRCWEKTQRVFCGLIQHAMAQEGHIQLQPLLQPSLSLGPHQVPVLGLLWSLMRCGGGPGWQVQPCHPREPPGAGCPVLACVAVLKVCPRSHCPWGELVPSWGEARGHQHSCACHEKGNSEHVGP